MRSATLNIKRTLLPTVIAALALNVTVCGEPSPPIRVMTSGAFTAALNGLSAKFERDSGTTIEVIYGASMGGARDTIPNRLKRGEPADVVIMAASALDDLITLRLVDAGSRVDLVRSSIGMAVRAGAKKPDISSVEALRQTLLRAKSIAYSSSASGLYLSNELIPRLGIANEIAAKSRMIETEPVGAVVARAEAEIGFQQISELRPVKGIDIVGPLPAGAQRITIFSAGIVATSTQPDAARRLIAFLVSPAAAAAIRRSGLEPVLKSQSDEYRPIVGIQPLNAAKTWSEMIECFQISRAICSSMAIQAGSAGDVRPHRLPGIGWIVSPANDRIPLTSTSSASSSHRRLSTGESVLPGPSSTPC
jgi:molybdate transport system substrate-binding protein